MLIRLSKEHSSQESDTIPIKELPHELSQTMFLVGSILLSASAWAEGGGDRVMERMESMRDKAEVVLIQAEKAPAGQRHVHMAEHMKMLGEIMSQLHQDHPDASMSPQQHLDWMEKHDKIVDDVLEQMQRTTSNGSILKVLAPDQIQTASLRRRVYFKN